MNAPRHRGLVVARRKSMFLAALVAASLAALSLGTSVAGAAPGVVQDLPGCRDNQLEANDDDSTDLVALGFTANIYDSSFTQAYVNNNGNITFDAALGEYTPFDFREPIRRSSSPFFADVDTSGDGVGPGQRTARSTTYEGHAAFCVIWDHVGYFGVAHRQDEHVPGDPRRPRAATATSTSSSTTTAITWETGDASGGTNGFGGTSAAAGYTAGDGDAAHALIASRLLRQRWPGGLQRGDEPRGTQHGRPARRALGLPGAHGSRDRRTHLRHGHRSRWRHRPRRNSAGVPPSAARCVSRTADARWLLPRLQPASRQLPRHRVPRSRRRLQRPHVYDNVIVGAPGTQHSATSCSARPRPPPAGTT